MKTGMTGRGRTRTYALGLAGLVLAAWACPTRAAAQNRAQDECRCVDRDGDPIENCSCFVLPRVERMAMPFAARPRIGISVSTGQASDVDAQGARVTRVLREGPAYEAGIREGDIITRIDGRSLLEPLDPQIEEDLDEDESLPAQRLLAIARELAPGQEVEIEYLRGAERRTVTVEAEDLSAGQWYANALELERILEPLRGARARARLLVPEPPPVAPFPRGGRENDVDVEVEIYRGGVGPLALGVLGASRYGLELVELNAELGAYFGTERGVLVADVEEGSLLGLRPGDVILRVGDRDVTTPERVVRILSSYAEDERVTFRVRRNGNEIDVAGRLGR
jgi:hypothetical protein